MMKGLLVKYAAYHVWANKLIADRIYRLDPETLVKEVPSSFPSLRSTCIHMLNAERIWWGRMKKITPVVMAVDDLSMPFDQIMSDLHSQSLNWKNFVLESSEDHLMKNLEYENLRGEAFVQPVGEMLLHLFNHGTYHRGQLITMMRMLGETNMPQTDFVLYCRKNN